MSTYVRALLILPLMAILFYGSNAIAGNLRSIDCRYYELWTDVDTEYGTLLARHLERVYEALSLNPGRQPATKSAAVYIFERRADLIAFSQVRLNYQVNPTTVAFFIPVLLSSFNPNIPASMKNTTVDVIVTDIEGDLYLTRTLESLQHECTHQFYKRSFGNNYTNIPGWISEGAAKYFGYMYCARNGNMITGIIPINASRSVGTAIRLNRHIPLLQLISFPPSFYSDTTQLLYYDEAWSLFHFLYDGNNGKYRKSLISYIGILKNVPNNSQLFEKTMGMRIEDLENEWKQYVLAVIPDILPRDLVVMAEELSRDANRETREISVVPKGWVGFSEIQPIKLKINYTDGVKHPHLIAYAPRDIVSLYWVNTGKRELWGISYDAYRQ